jgi:hypothetical protein
MHLYHIGKVLHRAVVYDADCVVLVVASSAEIIYILVINVPETVLSVYGDYFFEVQTEHLDWYHEKPLVYPRHLNLGHAVDIDTICLWKNMGLDFFEFLKDNKVGPVHDLKPYIIVLWYRLKGVQDVVSRQWKNVKIDFKSLNPRAFIFIRQIITQVLNMYLVIRIMLLKANGLENYITYK